MLKSHVGKWAIESLNKKMKPFKDAHTKDLSRLTINIIEHKTDFVKVMQEVKTEIAPIKKLVIHQIVN